MPCCSYYTAIDMLFFFSTKYCISITDYGKIKVSSSVSLNIHTVLFVACNNNNKHTQQNDGMIEIEMLRLFR